MNSTNGQMKAVGHTMGQLAEFLSLRLNEPVVDRTALQGPFVIELMAAPSFVPPRAQAELLAQGIEFSSPHPPLDVALKEQLGLKLERTQVDVEAIVIDRVERPTEN